MGRSTGILNKMGRSTGVLEKMGRSTGILLILLVYICWNKTKFFLTTLAFILRHKNWVLFLMFANLYDLSEA